MYGNEFTELAAFTVLRAVLRTDLLHVLLQFYFSSGQMILFILFLLVILDLFFKMRLSELDFNWFYGSFQPLKLCVTLGRFQVQMLSFYFGGVRSVVSCPKTFIQSYRRAHNSVLKLSLLTESQKETKK